MNEGKLKSEKLKAEMQEAEFRSQQAEVGTRHLTPSLSPIEAERVANVPCLTRLELAELLRVTVRTVDRMIAAGEIPVRRVRGRAVRFLRSDVDRYLNAGKVSTPHPAPARCEGNGAHGVTRPTFAKAERETHIPPAKDLKTETPVTKTKTKN